MSKELLIGGIHLRKVGHISNENPRKSINISTIRFPKIHGKVSGSKERLSWLYYWVRSDGNAETHIHFDNLLNTRPSSIQNSLNVVVVSLGLVADAALN
jgi:hypothetical protein